MNCECIYLPIKDGEIFGDTSFFNDFDKVAKMINNKDEELFPVSRSEIIKDTKVNIFYDGAQIEGDNNELIIKKGANVLFMCGKLHYMEKIIYNGITLLPYHICRSMRGKNFFKDIENYC